MNRHHLRFVLRQSIEHRNRSNLRLHVWTSIGLWLAITTGLSQIRIGVSVPLLGANVGAAFVVLSFLYWLPVDPLVVILVSALSIGWAETPFAPWGPGHGWLAGVAAPLVVFALLKVTERLAHIYHHEHAAFMKGGLPVSEAMESAHATLFAPFHFFFLGLLSLGWRAGAHARLHEEERQALLQRQEVPWINWAELASCRAQFAVVPETVEDLQAAVKGARERGQKVRVVASGFSWTSLVPSDDTLIFCERLDRITIDTSDPAHPSVWAEAGVTNRQLNQELARAGLSVPWNVVLETVRVAGLVTVGTHGTGKATSTVGDLVLAMEVVDAEGRLRVLSDETVGEEVMSAARLGFGLFGVIARVHLKVVPLERVRQTDARLPAREVLAGLVDLIRAHDSVELYWFPFNSDVWIRTIDRTEEPRTKRGHGFWFRAQNLFQNSWLVALSWFVVRCAPWLTPALLWAGIRMLPFKTRVLNLPESHHYHHWIEMMRCGCMEVGFKADPDCANVVRAWEATERLVAKYRDKSLYPLNLTLNVRFIGRSTALLTPAYGEGLTCYVEVMWRGRPTGWAEFTSELCREWLTIPGALPHWSKEFEHVEGVVPIIREHLGDRLPRFLAALRESGIDPDRRFWNSFVRRVLTDEAPAA
jgi:hypothetical protein